MFQFPTNGKAYPKEAVILGKLGVVENVSIPYEREGISKVNSGVFMYKHMEEFQFPTNGKAYPKNISGLL